MKINFHQYLIDRFLSCFMCKFIFFLLSQTASSRCPVGECRQYASLTKEQKEKLASGPSLEDFVTGDVDEYTGPDSLKRIKGER